jgi:hypothetical protein
LNQGATWIGKCLGVGFNFLDHQAVAALLDWPNIFFKLALLSRAIL